jgi:competence/damage-inducible protein CinA-like protein
VKAEVVAIGTELLLGDVVNGNAAWLGRELAAIGIDVERTTAVGDNIARIVEALASALDRADVVITTGGLGPTQDDLTREALATLAGVELVRDPRLEAALRRRYAAAGRPDFAPNNLRMADHPAGAGLLTNPAGTAPGLRVTVGDRGPIYALPGVPREMTEIFTNSVRAELVERVGAGAVVLSRALRTVGIWESEVAQLLAGLDSELAVASNPTIAYLAGEGETRVRITAKATSARTATALVHDVEARVRAVLGDVVFGVDDDTLEDVAFRALRDAGATIATAESLTGGLLGAALTSAAGASACYRGGLVTYSTEAKRAVLGVPAKLLDERGAVDAEVAVAMATAARERFDADFGLATTGVAGPATQEGKPVGTVFVALVGPDGGEPPWLRTLQLTGDRSRIRRASVRVGLDLVRRRLLGLPAAPAPFSPADTR